MKKKFKLQPMLLLAIAAVLLLGSAVGSTQAALIYYTEDAYVADVKVSNIGVSLYENAEKINYRDYIKNGEWNTPASGEVVPLMTSLKDVKIVPGISYSEDLQVVNSGAIDSYVRVIITKYWADKDGNKVRYWNNTEEETLRLNPAYIKLIAPEDSNWTKAADSTEEREIYYYNQVLPVGNKTDRVVSYVKIDPAVSKEVIQTVDGNKYAYEYKYDGYRFVVEAEVQAIQTHNAVDAIKSAWGVDVAITKEGLKVN